MSQNLQDEEEKPLGLSHQCTAAGGEREREREISFCAVLAMTTN